MATPDVSRLLELFRLDVETGRIYWRVDRFCGKGRKHVSAGSTAESRKGNGYNTVYCDGANRLAHRVAFALHHGRWPALRVDHINGDKADNRPVNLREATVRQNNINRPAPICSATGVKGVHQMVNGRFRAFIHRGAKRHIGVFDTIEEAAAAYTAEAMKLHGEFYNPG